tara:strand:- start:65 stop:328 length:264 start_codon:yes stop_codon:yes gene_type:complete
MAKNEQIGKQGKHSKKDRAKPIKKRKTISTSKWERRQYVPEGSTAVFKKWVKVVEEVFEPPMDDEPPSKKTRSRSPAPVESHQHIEA